MKKMKLTKTLLITLNVIICLSFGFFVLAFNQAGKPYIRGFYCNDESINKPYKRSTIPSVQVAIIAFIMGLVIFPIADLVNFVFRTDESRPKAFWLKFQRRRKTILSNFFVVYLLYVFGMGLTMFITDVGKYSVGRLRPHFYDVCKPNWANLNCTNDVGVQNYFIGDEFCDNRDETWKYKDARLSFPSGHSSYSAYVATFLILYIDSFIQIENPYASLPKMFIQIALATGAICCGLSRISDYKHHPTDVFVGLLLGFIVGVIVFYGALIRSCVPLLKVKRPSMSQSDTEVNEITRPTDEV